MIFNIIADRITKNRLILKTLTEKNTTKRAVEDISLFNEIGKTITSSLDIKEVLSIIMQKITEILKPKDWSLLLVDEKTMELYFEVVVGERAEKLKDVRIKIGEGIAGMVAKNGKPLIIENTLEDKRFSRRIDETANFNTRSIVCVPLKSKGKVRGVIELINTLDEGAFEESDLVFLQTIADYAAIAIENARYFLKVQELTITDDVTGLFNPRFLHQVIDSEIIRSQRYNLSFSIIFLDLDYFKKVNDNYGHLIGSHVLKETAEVLKSNLRETDIATRYGGDEFVVVLPETNKNPAFEVTKRIRKSFQDHIFGGSDLNIKITASFGISTFPDDAITKLDLIRNADMAMYRVKESGRDNIALA